MEIVSDCLLNHLVIRYAVYQAARDLRKNANAGRQRQIRNHSLRHLEEGKWTLRLRLADRRGDKVVPTTFWGSKFGKL